MRPMLLASHSGGGDRGGNGRHNDCNDVNQPICQLCGIVGHIASWCYKRFNREFHGVGNDGTSMSRQVAMATQGRPAALVVDTAWYMDTTTTDHLTGDLDRLNMQEPYDACGGVIFSSSSWEPQEEGMMSISARFSFS
jgi:hypothetical protein